MKRIRIKRHFALTLYYNRMCDKVFTALKVNAHVKARKRKENSQASGYITTSSSEIMHEASFTHRTKLNLSSLQQFVNNSSNHQLPIVNMDGTIAPSSFQAIHGTTDITKHLRNEPFYMVAQVQDHMGQQRLANVFGKNPPVSTIDNGSMEV